MVQGFGPLHDAAGPRKWRFFLFSAIAWVRSMAKRFSSCKSWSHCAPTDPDRRRVCWLAAGIAYNSQLRTSSKKEGRLGSFGFGSCSHVHLNLGSAWDGRMQQKQYTVSHRGNHWPWSVRPRVVLNVCQVPSGLRTPPSSHARMAAS